MIPRSALKIPIRLSLACSYGDHGAKTRACGQPTLLWKPHAEGQLKVQVYEMKGGEMRGGQDVLISGNRSLLRLRDERQRLKGTDAAWRSVARDVSGEAAIKR